jgi:hypothetical protein
MELKQCNKCKEVKGLEDFAWQYKKTGRRQPKCKSCMNAYSSEIRYSKQVIKKNTKGTYLGFCKLIYKPEYFLIYQKAAADNAKLNKQRYLANWRANNIGYQHKYNQQRKQKDPKFSLILATRSLISQSFKRACKGREYKIDHTVELLQCSLEFFIQYIQDKFTEGMTLENYGEWHLDHIIPLATATTREDVVRLNHYTNFQPLWAKDNLSKGAKIIK